jgi:hypothetical protein
MLFNKKLFVGRMLTVAALVLAGPAAAGPIDGTVTFSDGFATTATTTSIVSQLNVMDVNGNANANGCSGAFGAGCSSSGNYALVFDITVSSGQLVFDYNGFHFTATSFGSPNRSALNCDKSGNCGDSISFTATGDVTAAGFDPTPFFMQWSADATCTQNVIIVPMLSCGAGTISAQWTATIYAGNAVRLVPEPSSLALMSLGLLLLAVGLRPLRR